MAKSKQENQYYRWCFTFNNYEKSDITKLKILFNSICKKYVFQEEKGKGTQQKGPWGCIIITDGTPHLQGSINLKTKARLTELKKIDGRIHWEPTKNAGAADKYACKEETRIGEIYTFERKKAFIRTKSKFDDIKPREEILNIIQDEPDNRTINWIWSDKGGVGKTSTASYIEHNYEGVCIANGKGHDIKNTVIKHLEDNDLDILIINVPRCNENYVSWSAIEEIKDGLIYSGKYEGGFANIEHPHVIILANFEPNKDKLSRDRWNIINID